VGYRKGEPIITLHMEAYLGAPESYDAVRITGDPPLHMKIAGGVHGDIATASITVNSIPKVLRAAPGLRTMRDMALPSFAG
jgi:4-hydroxy-tetrahydrodipicolinate reductase